MHVFYRVMKGIYQFAANLLRNIPTKLKLLKSVNIWLSICEKQKGELFLKHSVDIEYNE